MNFPNSSPLNVSVVITTHNRASVVGGAIRSALDAAGVTEVIVVDDDSKDASEQVLDSFGSSITRVKGSFGTPGRARNAGASAATGELLAFLDSDDEMTTTKVTCCTPPFADPSVGMVHGRIEVIDADGARDENRSRSHDRQIRRAARIGTRFEDLALYCLMFTSATILRRAAFEAVGGYDESPLLKTNEDLDMYLRLSHEWRLVYVGCAAARYRIWGGNQEWREHAKGQIAVGDKHLKNEDVPRLARYGLLRRQAISYRVLGDSRRAQELAWLAWRCHPARFITDWRFLRTAAPSLLGAKR